MSFHLDSYPSDIWKFFYKESSKSNPIKGTNVKPYITINECFIFQCYFIGFTKNSAINFENNGIKLLYSDCLFNGCSSDTDGGAVHFECDSSIVQYRSCCYKSKTNAYWGHHSYVILNENSNNNKNYIQGCSFYLCGDLEKRFTNELYYGNIDVESTNTSFCQGCQGSGISLYCPFVKVTFSSFCNSTGTRTIIDIGSKICSIKICNILHNKREKINQYDPSTFSLLLSTTEIINSSILKNSGPGVEFEVDQSSLTIIDCFCDNPTVTISTIQSINMQNKYSAQKLSHFSSFLCEAKYPITKIKHSEFTSKYIPNLPVPFRRR